MNPCIQCRVMFGPGAIFFVCVCVEAYRGHERRRSRRVALATGVSTHLKDHNMRIHLLVFTRSGLNCVPLIYIFSHVILKSDINLVIKRGIYQKFL